MFKKLFSRPEEETNSSSIISLNFFGHFLNRFSQIKNNLFDSSRIPISKNEIQVSGGFKQDEILGIEEEMHLTGMNYETGEDDIKKAVKWYRKAANSGNLKSVYRLGQIYLNGRGGTGKNYKKAKYWFTRGAKWGDWDAMWQLGRMYENGWGVEKDLIKAEELYFDAARKGSEEAKSALRRLSHNQSYITD